MDKQASMTSRQIQAAKMKNDIYLCAIELFQNNAYEDISIADICRAAGISTGNFYHYFKNKDDVLGESFRRLDERFYHRIEGVSPPPLESIFFAFEEFASSVETAGYHYISIFLHHEILQKISPFNNPDRSIYDFVKAALVDAYNTGILINGDPNTLFYDIYRVYKGTTFDWVIQHGAFSFKDELFRMLELVLAPHLPGTNSQS